jgi:hemerythrin
MIRLIHWYLAGLPAQERVEGQRRLLQQVLMSVRSGLARQEETMRAMRHPSLRQAAMEHRNILGGIESVLQARVDEEEEARLRLRHALDDLLLQQLSEK